MLGLLELGQPSLAPHSQELGNPFADLPVHPGTSIRIFGPEQARAVEEAWYREFGVMSIYAVNPEQMASTPLDFDPSTITVTSDGRVIMPHFDAAASIPVEFAHLVEDGFGGGADGDAVYTQVIGGGDVGDGGPNDDGEPPYMIFTRLPRLLGLNVNQ
jgi:hypothetical protein